MYASSFSLRYSVEKERMRLHGAQLFASRRL